MKNSFKCINVLLIVFGLNFCSCNSNNNENEIEIIYELNIKNLNKRNEIEKKIISTISNQEIYSKNCYNLVMRDTYTAFETSSDTFYVFTNYDSNLVKYELESSGFYIVENSDKNNFLMLEYFTEDDNEFYYKRYNIKTTNVDDDSDYFFFRWEIKGDYIYGRHDEIYYDLKMYEKDTSYEIESFYQTDRPDTISYYLTYSDYYYDLKSNQLIYWYTKRDFEELYFVVKEFDVLTKKSKILFNYHSNKLSRFFKLEEFDYIKKYNGIYYVKNDNKIIRYNQSTNTINILEFYHGHEHGVYELLDFKVNN